MASRYQEGGFPLVLEKTFVEKKLVTEASCL